MSYKAIVCKIEKITPIPGADRIVSAVVLGNNVVVGNDTKEGDIVCFAPTDGIFEDEFCKVNDLFPRLDKDGKKIGGGFFTEGKARIRAQKFKKVKSEGFVFPFSYLGYTGYDLSTLKIGDQFDELNGVKICQKYMSPATIRAANSNKGKSKKLGIVTQSFPENVDYSQFKHCCNRIEKGNRIQLTSKLHGTHQRFGRVWTKKHLNVFQKFVNKFYALFPENISTYLVGTRRTILKAEVSPTSFYKNEEFRFIHFNKVRDKLKKGELIMGELVGYTTTGSKIMSDHETKETKDKEFIKRYGEKIEYTYSCLPNQCEFYVYRILNINEDGDSVDLSWEQVKKRCTELELKHVPEISNAFIFDGDIECLKDQVETRSYGPDLISPNIHREGLVCRVDNEYTTPMFLKEKNFFFGVMEGYLKSDDTYVDTEESV